MLAAIIRAGAAGAIQLKNEDGIAIAVEPVAFANRFPVGLKQKLATHKCTYEHEQSRTRQMKIRQKQINNLEAVWRINENVRQTFLCENFPGHTLRGFQCSNGCCSNC